MVTPNDQSSSVHGSAQALDLSIILVNWNGLEVTCGALVSIQKFTTGISYEVFVVDNDSKKDESAKRIPERHPWIHFIANPDNRGFSRANNQAIRRARGRYILLLNNDTIQIENALGKAVRYMDQHADVGALGITHLNNDAERSYQPSFFNFEKPWGDVKGLLGLRSNGMPRECDYTHEKDVDWIVGSFLMMRRECYEDVGELDERFFMYDEDMDWCFRARQAGWRVTYWPGAQMIHLGSATRLFVKDKTFMHFRSHLSYLKKNHSRAEAISYYMAMAARLSLATGKHALQALAGRSDLGELRKRIDRERQFLLLRETRKGV
ncbi:MAG TPA: glycosyltransferase family 2 protein [Polyangiaceae bacterium]|nr:glycosyltransferase family 2 protein [Polyangiaceae bacterium]